MTTPRTLPGTVKEQAVAGFGQAVSGYDEGSTEFFKDMGARLVNLAGVHAGADALDVGCGKGPVTIPAARLAGEGGCVHAIDLARPMLDTAAALARQSGLGNLTVARGDAEDPPFAAGTFDVILAGFLIQLLPRPAHAVQRWRALLKPGGTLSFSWGLAAYIRWMPAMAALDAHVPPGMSRFEAFFLWPPVDGTGHVDRAHRGPLTRPCRPSSTRWTPGSPRRVWRQLCLRTASKFTRSQRLIVAFLILFRRHISAI